MPNRLARERSPYLLQHANNPVEWFPWGDEAFETARREDKPIFLSIGYSTCHWCHVMEHESFEDQSIADVLNRLFVSVKVDREERPDVDRVYMAFVQATTGAGGWPMSVWITPDRKPFFGGTYFPPSSRWGRPGFIDVLTEIGRAWREERPKVLASAETVLERLRDVMVGDAKTATLGAGLAGPDVVSQGIQAFAQAFDKRHGGFGGSPKFPRPAELIFLLNAFAQTSDPRARSMALETLRAMAMGGMRDHIGGGFHGSSVDAEWRVPHFEKMLYDQAQLVLAYLEASQASGDPFYAAVAEDTLDYVVRDLTDKSGGFLSAEDADSLDPAHNEKREGAFYVWTAADIDALMGDDAPIVRKRFGIEDSGNALTDPQGEFRGVNIPYVAQSIEDVAVRTDRDVESVMRALRRARRAMFDARAKRPRPHLDDKVIAAWNGLMIAAMARAARQLVDSPRRNEWRAAAIRAAEFAFETLWKKTTSGVVFEKTETAGVVLDETTTAGVFLEKTTPEVVFRLLRRYRDGEAGIDAFCEDYACLAWGAIELFQTTADERWLQWARDLTTAQIDLFYDEADGGWFSTTGEDPSVLLRLKEDYDGAEPSAASVTVRNLIRLSQLDGDSKWLDRAQRTLERYGPALGQAVRVMPLMIANLALFHARRSEVVIVGADQDATDLRDLERVVQERYLPWAVTLAMGESRAASERSPGASAPGSPSPPSLPALQAMSTRDGRAAAYVCHEFTCQAPVTDPAELDDALSAVAGGL